MTPVNDPLSGFEHVARNLIYPTQVDKKGRIKNTAMYPRIDADKENPELINNKISLNRICRASDTNSYSPIVESSLKFVSGNRELRGFQKWSYNEILSICKNISVEVVPDASPVNPYHAHLVIHSFKVKYCDEIKEALRNQTLTYSDILPPKVKAALDNLRESGNIIEIEKGMVVGPQSPCSTCLPLT